MAGIQGVLKEKIRATATLEEVFYTMELITASRIGRAREVVSGLDPYIRILIWSIATMVLHDHKLNHSMLTHREDTNWVAVLVVMSDKGMTGAYSSSVLREADGLVEELWAESREPVLYMNGHRDESCYRFREIKVTKSWAGKSDNPGVDIPDNVAPTLLDVYLTAPEDGSVSKLIVVYTGFVSMVRQIVRVCHMFPPEAVEAEDGDEHGPVDDLGDKPEETRSFFEFESSAEDIFGALLPMYVGQHIHSVPLIAAASELVSCQQTIHSATENAQKLIEGHTRLTDNVRQAEITTEITEIVSGASALKQGA